MWNNMNITYLIGNGFDLACGLKTKYIDVYNLYCATSSKNENIGNFKKSILESQDINWTDFEMALPDFGKHLGSFDKFMECKNDFSQFLEEYLESQQDMINVEPFRDQLEQKMKDYIYFFYNFCLRNSKITLSNMIKDSSEHVVCNFITFNYTNTLEKCLSTMKHQIPKRGQWLYQYKTPLHIHGTIYKGIILGLDNEELYKDIPAPDERKLKNLLDKIWINNRYSGITDEVLNILRNSDIIVIFGWSMGQSDSFWVKSLKNILSKNRKIQLVYAPYYSEEPNPRLRNELLNREDEQKDYIASKFEISDEDSSRIHIITNPDYMKLDFLTKNTVDQPATA